MNDNLTLDSDDFPEWVWDIVEEHDLGGRTDGPLAGATVLLTDAGELVCEIAATAFEQQALTPELKQRLRRAIVMLLDVERLSTVCEDLATQGRVTVQPDGTKSWAPLPL
jgi:hypothetical protein